MLALLVEAVVLCVAEEPLGNVAPLAPRDIGRGEVHEALDAATCVCLACEPEHVVRSPHVRVPIAVPRLVDADLCRGVDDGVDLGGELLIAGAFEAD